MVAKRVGRPHKAGFCSLPSGRDWAWATIFISYCVAFPSKNRTIQIHIYIYTLAKVSFLCASTINRDQLDGNWPFDPSNETFVIAKFTSICTLRRALQSRVIINLIRLGLRDLKGLKAPRWPVAGKAVAREKERDEADRPPLQTNTHTQNGPARSSQQQKEKAKQADNLKE